MSQPVVAACCHPDLEDRGLALYPDQAGAEGVSHMEHHLHAEVVVLRPAQACAGCGYLVEHHLHAEVVVVRPAQAVLEVVTL